MFSFLTYSDIYMISRDLIELAAVDDISELWTEDGKQLLEGTLSFGIQENRRLKRCGVSVV